MDAKTPALATLDLVAKAQLELIHAAVASPSFDWEGVQQLVQLWRKTNGLRYHQAGLPPEDLPATLRMVFRDYVQEVGRDHPDEAERIRTALGPELEA